MVEERYAGQYDANFVKRAPVTVKRFQKEEEVFLKGKIKWCKHIRPDTMYPPGKWSVIMYVEGAELEKVREWQAMGIKNAVKKDEDGWFITLSRKVSITVKGHEVGLEPPKVIDKDGVPITDMVGNGSDGIAKCVLWSFNPMPGISGKALRWEALRVDNLIPFDSNKDYPDGGESIRTLKEEASEQLF